MHVTINGWFAGMTTAGSGQYIDHMLAHLPRQSPGTHFSLLLPEGGSNPAPAETKYAGVQVERVSLPRLPRNLAKLYREQISVPRAAKRSGADVLWVPYWAAPYWQPTPVVVTVHDLIPSLLPAYRGGFMQQLYTSLVCTTARRSSQVVAVSAAGAADVVAHLGIPVSRVHAVHHGPNQQDYPFPSQEKLAVIHDRYGLPERYFLYLGGFDVRKNVQSILAAYRRYLDLSGDPAVRLVIAGKLPADESEFFPDPRRMAEELGLSDAVCFCGWVAEEDKPGLYALSTGFLFPSEYEGFGMMVLEAMAAGTPVVTSDR